MNFLPQNHQNPLAILFNHTCLYYYYHVSLSDDVLFVHRKPRYKRRWPPPTLTSSLLAHAAQRLRGSGEAGVLTGRARQGGLAMDPSQRALFCSVAANFLVASLQSRNL